MHVGVDKSKVNPSSKVAIDYNSFKIVYNPPWPLGMVFDQLAIQKYVFNCSKIELD